MHRQSQFLLSCGLAVVSLFGGMALSQLSVRPSVFGQSRLETSKVIRAERVELVDTTGKLRAALTEMGEDAGLVLFDREGRAAVLLGVNDHGLILKFIDGRSNGKTPDSIGRARSLSDFWHFSYGADERNTR